MGYIEKSTTNPPSPLLLVDSGKAALRSWERGKLIPPPHLGCHVWHGREKDAPPLNPHHLWQTEELVLGGLRVGELVLPLTNCSPRKSGLCTSCRQSSRAYPGDVGACKPAPRTKEQENWPHPLFPAALDELARVVQVSTTSWWGWGKAGRLTKLTPTQAQNQAYEPSHPNIYPICEL